MPSFLQNLFEKRLRASLLCLFAGALCALGMAPYNFWPIFILGFGVLYFAIDNAPSKKAAFAYGWLWAFGYFVFSLYWIGNALLVEGNPYKWAWPLAVCGLPAVLAFFNAFACLITYKLCNLKRIYGLLGFVALLSLFEWIRGHAFTGFPWNLYGYTWADTLSIAQLASLESIYSLTAITLIWLTAPAYFVICRKKLEGSAFSVVLIASVVCAYAFGASRLQETEHVHENVQVKIVQPNILQADKWKAEKLEGNFETALALSSAQNSEYSQEKTLIIWPETAIPYSFLNSNYRRQQISDMLKSYQGEAVLLSGALRYEPKEKRYYNSLLSIRDDNSVNNIYDKSHLVPFGEYIPFQQWIPLTPVVQFQGFTKGSGPKDFRLFDTLNYSALICYEIIFPHKARQKNSRANFIVNVTNDAWYGDSPGPHQHLVQAQFRAIEEGVPVLRAANTGFSSIISPYGQTLYKTSLFEEESLTASLPIAN